jgi:hypothetical protein
LTRAATLARAKNRESERKTMKRWAGLLALFLVAAIGAVVMAPRFRLSSLERRHSTIRVNMKVDEVTMIMDDPADEASRSFIEPKTWSRVWLPPQAAGARGKRLEVEFDDQGHVIRTTVDGKQLQP